MSYSKMPLVIPVGWYTIAQGQAIATKRMDGLAAVFGIETFGPGDIDAPPMGDGVYHHISLSREDRYPSWDEMRDFVYSCRWFDHERDVVMLLPPPSQYVNVHQNCFHFYQKAS